ncbi:Hypothetical predicted protein [Octopus vulgaris]|uniref:Uncharacterized protein n=1 Tax=Octopus vulgaris TaxID=6645 RepID=A0AA36BPI5_OCTVU|nr:Hypothetical predicted protein [Octopus vulgaris]
MRPHSGAKRVIRGGGGDGRNGDLDGESDANATAPDRSAVSREDVLRRPSALRRANGEMFTRDCRERGALQVSYPYRQMSRLHGRGPLRKNSQ